jgi:hypothetical protein
MWGCPQTELSPHWLRYEKTEHRSEQLAMFRITAKTCSTFTLAEILIMTAMNLETIHPASADRVRPYPAAAQKR